jgi:hypothetical protein
MVDFLTHYYSRDTEPFRSLSALSENEALKIMKTLADDTLFGMRFKDPDQYMHDRKQTEKWVREVFIAKGGQPRAEFPILMVLGSSRWMVKAAPDPEVHGEIQIPLSVFGEFDVCFTYPNSMISCWFAREKPEAYYLPDYHGKVFTLQEVTAIVDAKGLPEESWETNLPDDLAPYIEAQVWNHEPLAEFRPVV